MMRYVEIVVRLISWLSAHLTSRNHTIANLHPIPEIKVSQSKLGFYLSKINNLLTSTFFKLSYGCLKLFPCLWDTLYNLLQQFLLRVIGYADDVIKFFLFS